MMGKKSLLKRTMRSLIPALAGLALREIDNNGIVGPDVGQGRYSRACFDVALPCKGLDGSCRHQNRVNDSTITLGLELSHQ